MYDHPVIGARDAARHRAGALVLAAGLLALAQVGGITVALFLHAFARLEPLRYTLAFSLLYSNATLLLVAIAFLVFRLDPRDLVPGPPAVLRVLLPLFLGEWLAFELVSEAIRRWLRPGYIPRGSPWHLELVATILGASILTAICWSFYVGMQRSLQLRALDVLRLEHATVRAQLDALQARLNPHFLFNSLNAIAALARRNPRQVEEIALDLAEIYRSILRSEEFPHPTLDDELALVRRYLAIEQARLGDKLTWEISIDGQLGTVRFPPLLLQPLVENAVVHGVSKSPKGGGVRIHATSRAGRLEVTVDSAGSGCPPATGPEGFGLGSVRERLRLLFDGRAGLSLAGLPGGGTRASMEIPLDDESRDRRG